MCIYMLTQPKPQYFTRKMLQKRPIQRYEQPDEAYFVILLEASTELECFLSSDRFLQMRNQQTKYILYLLSV